MAGLPCRPRAEMLGLGLGLGLELGLGSGWSGPTCEGEIDHTRRFLPTCTKGVPTYIRISLMVLQANLITLHVRYNILRNIT